MFVIQIDTGGTFTDGVLIDGEQRVNTAKYPTDIREPSISIMGCIALLAQERGLTEQELLRHTTAVLIGTTLPTNCILEGKGAKCCLIYTKGFKDMFELRRRIPKDDIYNLKVPAPRVLIPRFLRFGVEERVNYNGEIITPLSENDMREAIEWAKDHDIDVPVICFLHSYINPEHEEKAAELMKTAFPDVVVSSRILRRWIEYDRASTAAIAGYVKPLTRIFVGALEKQVKNANFIGTLMLLTCAGGVAAPELCLENPALLIGSGPAAGPLAGRFLAELAGFKDIIVCDMGGTSFDVSILPGRMITTTTEQIIGDQKMAYESVDVASIGAGGGSIAWVDERGVLRVGPSSAGADPGPACYGKGGQVPTVTDADVVLGYIPADYFLGGRLLLDAGLAEKVIEEKIAEPLGINRVEGAHAISTLVEANMADKIFLSAVEKGFDPRNLSLVVGGGAGPVHAAAFAAMLGIKHVYISKHAAVFCALGIASADYKHILRRYLLREQDEVTVHELKACYASLEEEAAAILTRQGVNERDMRFMRGAEIRYYGQLHDIEILLPEIPRGEPFIEEDFKALIEAFHKKYQAMYGWSNPAFPVTIVTLKLQAIGVRPHFETIKQPFFGRDPSGALKRKRRVYFKELEGFVDTPCYDGNQLGHGNVIIGPAIIEETKTTVVVPQGTELTVDTYGNYIMGVKQ